MRCKGVKHGYHFADQEKKIHSHQEYWIPKIEHNIARDVQVNEELTKEGYTILRFWGQEIEKDTESCVEKILNALKEKGYPLN